MIRQNSERNTLSQIAGRCPLAGEQTPRCCKACAISSTASPTHKSRDFVEEVLERLDEMGTVEARWHASVMRYSPLTSKGGDLNDLCPW